MASIQLDKKTGKYYFIVDAGKSETTGRRRQIKRRGFPTKTEAKKAMRKVLAEVLMAKELKQDPSKQLFEPFLENWFEAKRVSLRPSTIVNYRQQIDYNILPYLGHFKIADNPKKFCRRLLIGYIMSAILPAKPSEQLSA
ncbi:Arm DNA-binding domain-containing protein [Bacillus subtilis]|uniref:Arm DNA-binding domain-containing protein n=1 Tax=Bacillus subtilis TaxID=1423 RepID=UPI002555DC44|nr:Arm DNA-binding domain-containing protein [Bacillus subtilis]MDL2027823.1 Arm DNA-binding domain-containing protein [Bacillus subtilis]